MSVYIIKHDLSVNLSCQICKREDPLGIHKSAEKTNLRKYDTIKTYQLNFCKFS